MRATVRCPKIGFESQKAPNELQQIKLVAFGRFEFVAWPLGCGFCF
jgi:hypothetical protein